MPLLFFNEKINKCPRKGKGMMLEETLQLSPEETATFQVITASQIISAL